MSDIHFYVEATLRNEVLGVLLGASPEAWEASLGGDFLDDVQRSRMRRDYGLIEVAFVKRNGIWESVTVSVQIHRLARGLEDVVPQSLTDAYGEFSEYVPFDLFHEALLTRGGRLEEVEEPSTGGFRQFREPKAQSHLYVTGETSPGDMRPGSVWSIVLSRGNRL
ncbi:hypothetical protein [Streptomyces sp. BA2]|uniref:hypothetical protein n=1 Tax=Streptomyces sp. BA2 TaxID=436595 RepID=UPI0013230CFE|nr:hypothetical protein [Streptomyces sp. BA2]MWA12850.1 hypothetical protein [Streptomyces sp. BA2]